MPQHSNLDNYQRFLLNNPKMSLRNKMSDLGPVVVKDHARTGTRKSTNGGGTNGHTGGGDGPLEQTRHSDADTWNKPPRAVSRQHSALSRGDETQHSFVANHEAPFANDVQDAAGYSELQAAFERAYERMLKDPPSSVVDTVLSSAWKPRSKKSAVLRTSFQKQNALSTDWDTRSPLYEKKLFYDSLQDQHCRRVVENPLFKQTLLRTRPAADYLLAHRIMDEESTKMALKKGKKRRLGSRRGRREKVERWQETVRRFVQGGEKLAGESSEEEQTRVAASRDAAEAPPAEAEADASAPEAVASGEEDAANRGRGIEEERGVAPATGNEELGRHAMDAVAELKKAWGVTEDGPNSQFNSLNSIIMSAGHRPEASQALSEQLEKLWELLHAPAPEVLHVRRYCMGEASATNLAHLFYQVSRWTQYHMQVQKTCELVYRREMLLLDLRDHLLLAGGLPDHALTSKLADFFAFSHEAIQHVNAVQTSFPGAAGQGCLLLDYIPKVRADVVEVKQRAPAVTVYGLGSADMSLEEEEDADLVSPPRNDVATDYMQHKVKLAAGLVLESVQREAQAYLKLLSVDHRRSKGRRETARPP